MRHCPYCGTPTSGRACPSHAFLARQEELSWRKLTEDELIAAHQQPAQQGVDANGGG